MIEEILSPDLRLERRRDEALALRLDAAKRFRLGDVVQAGEYGKPGLLEDINGYGFASIRWPEGPILCGVPASELVLASDGDIIRIKAD